MHAKSSTPCEAIRDESDSARASGQDMASDTASEPSDYGQATQESSDEHSASVVGNRG